MFANQRRWWALGALSLAVLVVGLDGTILSVALPTLSSALHASESDLQWFSSAYLLVLAAAMLPVGLLGDRYGRKQILLGALALFGLGSGACAYSTSVPQFLAARVVLGLAGAGVVVMAISAITVLFDEDERPRAVGVWAAANFLALPIGPILGGWLLTHRWWGWVFLINVPVVAIALIAVAALVPESRATRAPGLDPVGIATSTGGLSALTYGLIRAGEHHWTDPRAVVFTAIGLAALAGFIVYERRLERAPDGQPLLDLTLFRSAAFTWGVILAAVAVLAMFGVLFTMPQYFQGVRGTDAVGSGLRLMPLIGGLVLGSVPADGLVRRLGAKAVVAGGFVLLATGLLLGATTTVDATEAFVAGWMALVGLGMGLALATTSAVALADLPQERSGIGSAVLQAVNKVGSPLGTAVLGSVLSSGYLARLDLSGLPAPAAATVRESVFGGVAVAARTGSASLSRSVRVAFVHGMDVALVVSAVFPLVGALLAVAFLPARPAHPAPATGKNARGDVVEVG